MHKNHKNLCNLTITIKLFILIFSILLFGCSTKIREFSETKILMGTTVEIKVWSHNEVLAKKSIAGAFDEITRVENIFSVYRPTSEISKLNKNGSAVVSDEIMQLIKKSNYFSEISDGAFDITVLPIIELWKNAKKRGEIPKEKEIKNTLKIVGWRNILIDEKNRKITFVKKGMKIDLGAIAKGYAVDRAVEVLKKNGIKTGMINAGGDIKCFGDKVWKIALQNPRDKNDFITILKIKNKAVTTSGDYERYFLIDKIKVIHIINPLTGYSVDKSISSTIITDNATDADALATATFVLGNPAGIELVKKYKVAECLIILPFASTPGDVASSHGQVVEINKEKRIYKTTGFAHYE
ncbi:MAG: FAD:protein FMN transferase [Elusimicrobiota bacterium]